mgnify:CR=1 FL=1
MKTLKLAIPYLIIALIVYLLSSFVNGTFNIVKETPMASIFITCIIFLFVCAGYALNYAENKKK